MQLARHINLYVQLPNETMSELVREYTAHFFDKRNFNKSNCGEEIVEEEVQRKIEEELNLSLNPTSLLEKGSIIKKVSMPTDKIRQDSILNSNRSDTADFLQMPKDPNKNPYGQKSGSQVSPVFRPP